MTAITHAYVGRHPCGHVYLVVVDDGADSNAREVAKCIRGGGTIERMAIEAVRTIKDWCNCKQVVRL